MLYMLECVAVSLGTYSQLICLHRTTLQVPIIQESTSSDNWLFAASSPRYPLTMGVRCSDAPVSNKSINVVNVSSIAYPE